MTHFRYGMLAFSCLVAACGDPSQNTSTDPARISDEKPAIEPVGKAVAASVDSERLRNAFSTPEEWLTYGFTYDEQRYSPLSKIDVDTVSNLGVAWTYDLKTSRGVEATPIVIDGVMYVTSAWSVVHALDAKTGEETSRKVIDSRCKEKRLQEQGS